VGIIFSIILVAIGVLRPPWMSRFVLIVTRPLYILKTEVKSQSSMLITLVKSHRSMQEENERLVEELRKAEIKAQLFDELYLNSSASTTTDIDRFSARVLSSPPFSPYDTLILDGGSLLGISEGDSVSYDGAVALGVVDLVSERTSRVRLFSSPGSEQPVRIGNGDYLVVARGVGGGAFLISVLKEEAVSRGEGVFLPDGQLIARIERVEPNETDAFVLAYAVIPVTLFEIKDVVVTPSL